VRVKKKQKKSKKNSERRKFLQVEKIYDSKFNKTKIAHYCCSVQF